MTVPQFLKPHLPLLGRWQMATDHCMKPKISYYWMWSRLSLFRNEEHEGGLASSCIFTLWLPWWWWRMRNPDPFKECHRWLVKNKLWDTGDFHAALEKYANHSEPGTLMRLNPKLLK